MPIHVTRRRLDAKRRVTIPDLVDLEAGNDVVVLASEDSAIIAANEEIARKLGELLRTLEARRKRTALDEWERLVSSAGLSALSSKEIDEMLARRVKAGR